jgi:hypothetical protein
MERFLLRAKSVRGAAAKALILEASLQLLQNLYGSLEGLTWGPLRDGFLMHAGFVGARSVCLWRAPRAAQHPGGETHICKRTPFLDLRCNIACSQELAS